VILQSGPIIHGIAFAERVPQCGIVIAALLHAPYSFQRKPFGGRGMIALGLRQWCV
jgi:hypothetical protein